MRHVAALAFLLTRTEFRGRRVLSAGDTVAARLPAAIRRSWAVRAMFNSAVSDASAAAT